jgi:hypothetical protein
VVVVVAEGGERIPALATSVENEEIYFLLNSILLMLVRRVELAVVKVFIVGC